ncbi:MAG: tryptophan synthase subunit alpha [Spirochaetaceae bacterium]|nr:tryptophan synthase subunit alpha [Spirochaetaceae bacterium]MCF7939862.1 tryptophan synthase subunit alpha [Spirochaetales bacterium]
MNKPVSIMAHCVALFPDAERSMAAARALDRGGADYLEVQFPFSDPIADGPAIQTACRTALENGFTVDKGFLWVEKLTAASSAQVYIMSYANLLFRRGIDRFCRDAAEAGAGGLIVPDLLPPADEGLYRACAEHGLDAVPVISPGISDQRLSAIRSLKPRLIYTTLRSGITGGYTEITDEQLRHLRRCKDTGAHVAAGFGIEGRDQVTALARHTQTLVAGSVFVKQLIDLDEAAPPEKYGEAVRRKLADLYGENYVPSP